MKMVITMYLIDHNILLVISNALMLILVISLNIKFNKKIRAVAIENTSIKSDLNAVCRGAMNVDKQLEFLGNQIKRISERQEKYDTSDFVKKEYDHAIRAIKSGASVERLVNIHGLSQPEAKLLLSLHGDECEHSPIKSN
jgi:hypothetical protein